MCLLRLLQDRDHGDPIHRFPEPGIDMEQAASGEPGIREIEIFENKNRGRPAEEGTMACPPLITMEGG